MFYGAKAVDCVNNMCVATRCRLGTLQNGYCADDGCNEFNPKRCIVNGTSYCCPKSAQSCNEHDMIKCEQSIVLD